MSVLYPYYSFSNDMNLRCELEIRIGKEHILGFLDVAKFSDVNGHCVVMISRPHLDPFTKLSYRQHGEKEVLL